MRNRAEGLRRKKETVGTESTNTRRAKRKGRKHKKLNRNKEGRMTTSVE